MGGRKRKVERKSNEVRRKGKTKEKNKGCKGNQKALRLASSLLPLNFSPSKVRMQVQWITAFLTPEFTATCHEI